MRGTNAQHKRISRQGISNRLSAASLAYFCVDVAATDRLTLVERPTALFSPQTFVFPAALSAVDYHGRCAATRSYGCTIIHHTMIREATSSDIPNLAKVHVASWQAAYRDILPAEGLSALSVERHEVIWQRNFLDTEWSCLLMEHQSRLVGFVAFGASHDDDADASQTGEIHALYLLPEMWGAGHGRALCERALHNLKARGLTEVMVWVLQDNKRATRFYKRMGFHCDNTTKTMQLCSAELCAVRYRIKP